MFRVLLRPVLDSDSSEHNEETKQDKSPSKTEPDPAVSKSVVASKKRGIVSGESILSKSTCSLHADDISDFVMAKPNLVAKMFMLYDCQPYSENLSELLISVLSLIARDQVAIDSDGNGVIVCKDEIAAQMNYLDCMQSLLASLQARPSTEDIQTKLNFLLENKQKVKTMERALKTKGRKGVIEIAESLVGTEEDQVLAKIAEFLLYSRNIPVESVLELIGDKRNTSLIGLFMKHFEPIMINKNIEKCLREVFTSFRLAGVESQTVERVLEQFGFFYYDIMQKFTVQDGILKFANQKESYDFVYLLIMLHTCHHNPNITNKTNFKWFLDSVKDLCKESYPSMTEKDLSNIFHSIEAVEFESPLSRNLRVKQFSLESLPIELYIRTKVQKQSSPALSDAEFVN